MTCLSICPPIYLLYIRILAVSLSMHSWSSLQYTYVTCCFPVDCYHDTSTHTHRYSHITLHPHPFSSSTLHRPFFLPKQDMGDMNHYLHALIEHKFRPHGQAPIHVHEGEEEYNGRMNPYKFLPQNLTYWHYTGSLTTPPCTTGIRWIVLQNPIYVNRDQIYRLTTYVQDIPDHKVGIV